VTELSKSHRMAGEYSDGVIGAHHGAIAAISALLLLDNRDRYKDRLAVGNDRSQEDMSIGLLDVTVEELDFLFSFQRQGKTGCYQGLAGTPPLPLATEIITQYPQ
jgi:hypothetical protein